MTSTRIAISPEVLAIARRLDRAGFDTWCVGGAVRDYLMKIENSDFDLATSATPAEVQRLFRRTVPIGIEHGTVAVLDRHNVAHEVTTFRKDIRTDGRHAVVEFGVSIDEDLARRDFTINAIAYHPMRHEWKDPHHGYADLEAGLIRAVGAAEQRFREDYLRILRCIRFATRFGFRIDDDTWRGAKKQAAGVQHLSAERVREEWFKSLSTARSVAHLCRYWAELGVDDQWLPGIDLRDPATTDRAVRLDRRDCRDAVLCTAYLSVRPSETLQVLRCSRAEIERGRGIETHRHAWPSAADLVAVRKWMARVSSHVDDLLTVAMLDEVDPQLTEVVEKIRASGAPLALADLAVNGSDLQQAGIAEGPQVGHVLQQLLDIVLEKPERNTKVDLLQIVEEVKPNA